MLLLIRICENDFWFSTTNTSTFLFRYRFFSFPHTITHHYSSLRTNFFPLVSLLSLVAHASASIGLSLVVFEDLPCSSLWFILGFCSLLPAVVEIVVVIGVVGLKKSILWPKVERRSWWKRRKKTEKKIEKVRLNTLGNFRFSMSIKKKKCGFYAYDRTWFFKNWETMTNAYEWTRPRGRRRVLCLRLLRYTYQTFVCCYRTKLRVLFGRCRTTDILGFWMRDSS